MTLGARCENHLDENQISFGAGLVELGQERKKEIEVSPTRRSMVISDRLLSLLSATTTTTAHNTVL